MITQPDLYLLTVHEPYPDSGIPVPMTALVVHGLTLRHPDLPQPDGALMYRCLTEAPGRRAGEIVPVSTLSFELAGGLLWPDVADWEAVTTALVTVARAGKCDAMRLALDPASTHLLAMGPTTTLTSHGADGTRTVRGPADRQAELDMLGGHLRRMLTEGPLWPGNNLVQVPGHPRRMPYRPYRKLPT